MDATVGAEGAEGVTNVFFTTEKGYSFADMAPLAEQATIIIT